jgi:hypothetical protein
VSVRPAWHTSFESQHPLQVLGPQVLAVTGGLQLVTSARLATSNEADAMRFISGSGGDRADLTGATPDLLPTRKEIQVSHPLSPQPAVLRRAFMGRIFETRKATMFARWNKMAKAFTRISKEITIAVKAGGVNPESNPALRRAMLNARAANMPKDKVENAIKRASGADAANYETVMYEGYAPHGVPLLIETATDNIVRTVGNVRAYFNKIGRAHV